MTYLLILLGKLLSYISQITNHGNGSTWPGHIALLLYPSFLEAILANSPSKIIFVVGTNGKTTTSRVLSTLLEKNGKTVLQNTSGANLVNGIASSLLLGTNSKGKITAEYAIFEVDENALPLLLTHITPKVIIALNLFRDQLDRYGELDGIARKWKIVFKNLPKSTTLILNADDPQIAYLGDDIQAQTVYFGMATISRNHTPEHGADSLYCPRCQAKLAYIGITYSHLGNWECKHCHLKRPHIVPHDSHLKFPLPGSYNAYNVLAAVNAARVLGIGEADILSALVTVTPAFGRQEKLVSNGRQVQLFLSKNPTSFNQSLETVRTLGGKHVMFILNDSIPDGRDISWIWDIDIENIASELKTIVVSGDRAYDMGLRIAYSEKTNLPKKLYIEANVAKALAQGLAILPKGDTLFILPTYSAMLEARKILTGKKIL